MSLRLREGALCAVAALVLCSCYTRQLFEPRDADVGEDAAVVVSSADAAAEAGSTVDAFVRPEGPLVDCTQWQQPVALQKTCAEASGEGSNLGCVYWPTPTANTVNEAFDDNFGVVVHNPGVQDATVVIRRDGVILVQEVIAGGQLRSFELPLDTGLKLASGAEQSLQVAAGAYRLESSRPVAVYQFNPLDFRLDFQTDVTEYSYSNDASLVLPEHGLGMDYVVVSRPTFGIQQNPNMVVFQSNPGFFAVVGTQPDTQVHVTFSAHTQWGPTIPSYAPGDEATFTIQPGEVLQIASALLSQCIGTEVVADCGGSGECHYCDPGADYDLTGTRIRASAPVSVFAGHSCTFIPFDTWACDHLEEQLLPVTAWGTRYVVTRTMPQSPDLPEPNVVRIISAQDGNVIRFDPPQADGASVVLDAGEWTEFESGGDFLVFGDGPLLVMQHTVGQNAYVDFNDGSEVDHEHQGDPAMGQVPPVDQFRRNYYVLAPDSMPFNYINVVRPRGLSGGETWLDGCRVLPHAFVPVGVAARYEVARIPIAAGPHRIVGEVPMGVMGYGFAPYTSYLYPAGLNLHSICDVN